VTGAWTGEDREATLRGLDPATRRIVRAWNERDTARLGAIPWTPLARPLGEARVALVSTAGLALREDRPFDQEGERRNPWWGDPSFRVLPRSTRTGDVRAFHLHADPSVAEADLGSVLPLERLLELERDGVVGSVAESHYSFMGNILKPGELLGTSLPAMVARMRQEAVDAVLLAPV
jgi:D-proline reductase (dithiol) PrdB